MIHCGKKGYICIEQDASEDEEDMKITLQLILRAR